MSSSNEQRSKVVADDLSKDQVSEMIQYILGISNGQFRQKGKAFEVVGVPRKKLKFFLHKFLQTHRLDDYGVLDTSGVFEIIHIKPEKKNPKQDENLKSTMPFWPPYNVHPVKPSEMIEWQGKSPKDKRD